MAHHLDCTNNYSISCAALPIVAVAVPLGIDRDFMLGFNDNSTEVRL